MPLKTRKPKQSVPGVDLDKREQVKEMLEAPAEPFGDPIPDHLADEFTDNAEQRLPCVLVLDTSGSMRGDPIARENAGLVAFRDAVLKHALLRRQLDVSVVSYNDEPIVMPFVNAAEWTPPVLTAAGHTRSAFAIGVSLDQLEKRLAEYNAHGVTWHLPWVFFITDGVATESAEETKAIAARIQRAEAEKKLHFFPVGVNSSAMKSYLASLSKVNGPLWLDDLDFPLFFRWLLGSLNQKSISQTTERIELANPLKGTDNPDGWAQA